MSVKLQVTHSVLPIASEKRADLGTTIGQLKVLDSLMVCYHISPFVLRFLTRSCLAAAYQDKLYLVVGTPSEYMRLELRNKDGQTIAVMDDDHRTLGSYGVMEFAYVHVC